MLFETDTKIGALRCLEYDSKILVGGSVAPIQISLVGYSSSLGGSLKFLLVLGGGQ